MNKLTKLVKSELCFFPELGYGHYPVPKDRPYDEEYFEKYRKMANTEMGDKITQARIDLVRRHYSGSICDVGIGSGQFVETCDQAYGYDVNPAGIRWLKDKNKFHELYINKIDGLTFWDSLEHIDTPENAIAMSNKWVFVSIPIFDSAEHILSSRHFRKDEHIWYFTHDGLIDWFYLHGFRCVEYNKIETEMGRDGIFTYAFERFQ